MKVTESPGADEVNTATVSGGGAEPASVSNPVVISSTPAGYGISPGDVLAGVSTDQAGAHANVTTGFVVNTKGLGEVSGTERDVRVDLPPGAVGNATQLPKCTIAKVLRYYRKPARLSRVLDGRHRDDLHRCHSRKPSARRYDADLHDHACAGRAGGICVYRGRCTGALGHEPALERELRGAGHRARPERGGRDLRDLDHPLGRARRLQRPVRKPE